MGTVQNGFDLSQYRGELQSENRIDIAVRVKKLTKMSEEVLRYVVFRRTYTPYGPYGMGHTVWVLANLFSFNSIL